MGQIVEVPGHGDVEFPDGMTDEQIASAIKANLSQAPASASLSPPAEGVLPEVGRVLDKGVRGGLMAAPALMDLGIAGAKQIPKLAYRAATGEWLKESLPPMDAMLDAPGPEAMTPQTSMVEGLLKISGGELSKPQTTSGKYAGSAIEGLIGALAGPGGMIQPVRNAAIGTTAGLGSELGAQAVQDENSVLGRVGGGLLGGGLTALGTSFIPNSKRLIQQATEFVPETDWRRGQELANVLEEKGVPYLASQVLGPSSTLDDVVAQAATNPAARPKFMQHLRDLPDKARSMFDELINTTFPVGVEGRKGTIQDIQELAAKRIEAEKGLGRQKYATNLRPGVNQETYDMFEVETLRNRLLAAGEDSNILGKGSPGDLEIKAFVNKYLPELQPGETMDKGTLNSIVKSFNEVAPKEGYGDVPSKIIATTLKDFTDADYSAARRAASNHWKNSTNPLQRSIVGELASMGGGVKQDKITAKETAIGWLFPKDQDKTREIAKVSKELGGDTVGQLLREHIMKSVSSTFKRANDVEKIQQPYKVLQTMLGTKEQTANVKAAIGVMAREQGLNPRIISKEFFRTIDALDTVKDLKIPPSVDRAALQQQAGENLLSFVIATASRAGRSVWEKVTAKAYNQVADIVTSPDGLKQIEAIAKSPTPKARQALIRAILTTAYDQTVAEEGQAGE